MRRWKELNDAFDNEKIIKGKIIRRIKGGLIGGLGGASFFCQVPKLMFAQFKTLMFIWRKK